MTSHEVVIYKYVIVQIEQYTAEIHAERNNLDLLNNDDPPLIWPDDETQCPRCRGECEIQDNHGIAHYQCIVCGYEW